MSTRPTNWRQVSAARERAVGGSARPPRRVSPGAAARRALLVDSTAALALAVAAIVLTAGIGVVGFFALLALLALLSWIGIEAALGRVRRPRGRHRERRRASAAGARR